MIYSNGNRYDGEWQADKKHGKGIFTFSSLGDSFYGEWVRNEEQGVGIYTFKDGSKERRDYRNGMVITRVKLC